MSHSFEANEGQYQFCSCPIPPYKDQPVNSVAVRLSFLDSVTSTKISPAKDVDLTCNSNDATSDGLYCYNVGKELYMYSRENHNIPVDRRVFKVPPTCHTFKQRDTPNKPYLAVGLLSGEIHLLYPRKDICKVFNEEKAIDMTSVTCIAWVPGSPNQFIVGHLSGNIYLYDENIANVVTPPSYELFKESISFSVYTCKAKSTRNPLYRWVFSTDLKAPGNGCTRISSDTWPRVHRQMSHDCEPARKVEFFSVRGNSTIESSTYTQSSSDERAAINQFAFSPCEQYLAVVTEDGYLRVIEYHIMELYGFMRSYFAGLLCVDWSPDGRYIAVGGQDDLVTVWSMAERAVICRGQGHRSWVSSVRFDPFLCPKLETVTIATTSSDHRHQNSVVPNGSRESPTADLVAVNGNARNGSSYSTEPVNNNSSSLSSSSSTTTLANIVDGVPLGVTYRLGSVGQDTFFCLWDLTDDVIRHGIQFVHEFSRMRLTSYSPKEDCHSTSCNKDQPTSQTTGHKPSLGVVSSRNNPSSTPSSNHTTNGPSVGGGRTLNSSTTGLFNFLTMSKRKYGSLASERSGKRGHQRNRRRLLPETVRGTPSSTTTWFNLTNDASTQSASMPVRSQTGGRADLAESLLGSPMCPRLSDVPVLEPIVCNMMHQHRLTDLAFRRCTVAIVCQQGLMRVWSRPKCIEQSRSVSPERQPDSFDRGDPPPPVSQRNASGETSGVLNYSQNSTHLNNHPSTSSVTTSPVGSRSTYQNVTTNLQSPTVNESTHCGDKTTSFQSSSSSHRIPQSTGTNSGTSGVEGSAFHSPVVNDLPSHDNYHSHQLYAPNLTASMNALRHHGTTQPVAPIDTANTVVRSRTGEL